MLVSLLPSSVSFTNTLTYTHREKQTMAIIREGEEGTDTHTHGAAATSEGPNISRQGVEQRIKELLDAGVKDR
jgi:hypothetical protein